MLREAGCRASRSDKDDTEFNLQRRADLLSVEAYLSSTIFLNFAISPCESGGTGSWTMVIV